MILSDDMKDLLGEFINMGVGRASGMLSELLGQVIEMRVPVIEVLGLEDVRRLKANNPQARYVLVVQEIIGDFSARGVLAFPLLNGKTLVDALMETPDFSDSDFNVVEIEAIQEVGNMVINAVGSVISDMSGAVLDYNLPKVSFDNFTIPILDDEPPSNAYFMASTAIFVQGIEVEGQISLVMPEASLARLEVCLG